MVLEKYMYRIYIYGVFRLMYICWMYEWGRVGYDMECKCGFFIKNN